MSNKTDRETRGAMASTSQLYKQGKLSRPKLAQTEGNKTDREATCLRCGNKVGNPVFTFCDDCWGSRPAAQPQRSKTMGVGRDLAAEQRDLNEPKHPCDQPRPSNLSSDTNGNPTDRGNASGSVSDAGTKQAHPLSLTQAPSNSGRDWPEDAADEDNGRYQNTCRLCGNMFIGHKRRVTCKLCSNGGQEKWHREDAYVLGTKLLFEALNRREASKAIEAHNAARAAMKKECADVMDRHEQQLSTAFAAEREKLDLADRDRCRLSEELCKAQAAIAEVEAHNIAGTISRKALAKHDAKVRKPLVDLLLECRLEIQTPMNKRTTTVLNKIDDALAKVPNKEPEYAGAWERRANRRGQRK